MSTSLANNGDGGRPARAPSEMPSADPRGPCVRADSADGVAGRARFVPEQRRRRVEAERLRQRVSDDVHDDACERERRAEADAERDDAHVLEARVGEQPLPGHRLPQERHGDREREEAEADEHRLRRGRADDRE